VGEFCGRLSDTGLFGQRLPAQHYVLNIRSIGVGVLSGLSEIERGDQPLRNDWVGESLKQLERSQASAKQLQAVAIGREDAQNGGPLLGDLAEQLESGAVLEPFRGYNDLEGVRAQQVEAIALVCNAVDAVQVPERSGDRQVAGRILVYDEHTHAGTVPAHSVWGSAAGHGFHIPAEYSVLSRTHDLLLAHRSVDAACMGHIWDTAQSPQHARELLEIGD
jgi:hypothetical protein